MLRQSSSRHEYGSREHTDIISCYNSSLAERKVTDVGFSEDPLTFRWHSRYASNHRRTDGQLQMTRIFLHFGLLMPVQENASEQMMAIYLTTVY